MRTRESENAREGVRTLDGRGVVPAMDLVEVDVIKVHSLETLVDGPHDVSPRESAAVGSD